MVKLIETYTPLIGEPKVTVREFPTRNALKKSLRMSPIETKIAYDLLKHGRAEIEYRDGKTTIVLEEHPKLIILGNE